MTLFGLLSMIAVVCIIIFSGLSIEDFSNFFNSLFDVTKEPEVTVIETDSVTKEDIKKMWETEEVENKKEISNKQRLFNWVMLMAMILLMLFGMTFFTGTSVPENVDGTVSDVVGNSVPENVDGTIVEAFANSADDSSASSYSEEYSDEFYAWCEEQGISPHKEANVVTEKAPLKSMDSLLEEDSWD